MDVLIPCMGRNKKIRVVYTSPILTCPVCKAKVPPSLVSSLTEVYNFNPIVRFLATFPCCGSEHIIDCSNVAGYDNILSTRQDSKWEVEELKKEMLEYKDVPELIDKVSPSFKQIYREAQAARQLGYTQICGGGYRKALEFLLRDYAILLHPEEKDEIQKMELSNCIAKYVDNDNIKCFAQRAAWLGNDELHYLKRWEDLNISNLEDFIVLSIFAIDLEEKRKKSEESMPNPVKKKQ